MKYGLISTLNTNIGDDFIRQGVIAVLEGVTSGNVYEVVNKHRPLIAYQNTFSRLADTLAQSLEQKRFVYRYAANFESVVSRVLSRLGTNSFASCGAIVECGMPVLFPHCHRMNWTHVLWRDLVWRHSATIPNYVLAAGSCYPWESREACVAAFSRTPEADFARKLIAHTRFIGVRDELCGRLFAELGGQPVVLPCTAFLAPEPFRQTHDAGILYVNFMEGGGHFDWGQGADRSAWRRAFLEVIRRLRSQLRVVWLTHSKTEENLARELGPDDLVLRPQTPAAYFQATAQGTVSLCNRLHASVALAGLGIPGVAVGTDTRLLMVQNIGQNALYVKDACDPDRLHTLMLGLIAQRTAESQRLINLQSEAKQAYIRHLHPFLNPV
jgi:hypothetical protein